MATENKGLFFSDDLINALAEKIAERLGIQKEDRPLTIAAISDRFGCSRATVYKLLNDGRLRSFHVGRRRYVLSSEADRCLRELAI